MGVDLHYLSTACIVVSVCTNSTSSKYCTYMHFHYFKRIVHVIPNVQLKSILNKHPKPCMDDDFHNFFFQVGPMEDVELSPLLRVSLSVASPPLSPCQPPLHWTEFESCCSVTMK